ncbi:hypothetical protein [Mycobacterium sp. AZCC_0083]|uniref:hypothetical protein n=1 Tax=Mycobacterium sp. AZCC_0083 TaxID=2735882 RepID=UPI001611F71B|nr:hypothetical protein [Mycobacterium sp. AZCC_0083]MBB5163364.1 hypothetical protein [Mycobacterium sp. AZCC_0083]
MDGHEKAVVIAAIQLLAEENGGMSVGRDRFIPETGFPEYLFQGFGWRRAAARGVTNDGRDAKMDRGNFRE